MIYLEFIAEAVRNLSRHKLRSFLTALGIIFGIASVMTMVSTGEGARRAILAQISELGIRNIIINTKKPPEEENVQKAESGQFALQEYGLTFRDAEQIRSTLETAVDVIEVHDVKQWIWFKSRRLEANVRGVPPAYFDRLGLATSHGRVLSKMDGVRRRRVCVVRARLLREAKYVGDPLRLDLKLGSEYYRVVGVLPDVTMQSTNQAVLGMDASTLEVFVPFETVVDRFGLTTRSTQSGSFENSRVELHQIICTARSEDDVIETARGIQSIMRSFHDRPDYDVVVPLELLESRQRTQRVFNIVMPIIAGISLLVGGIGVLNIMLASITERTREIGIRRAIGATRFDITLQFLIETVTLALIGGLLGVALGIGGVKILDHLTEWQPVVTPGAVTVSLIISCSTGVAFGIYPARRAARMDPIRALRHD